MAARERWVVVGAGSAGCVIAARLSERDDRDVTLLEAGVDHPTSRPPDDVGTYLTDPARIRPGVEVVRRAGEAPVPYAQGTGLGGSSLINGSVVVPHPDLDRARHLLPLEPAPERGAVGAALATAAPDAVDLLQVRRRGVRVTTADVYVRPILTRPGFTVVTDSAVDRIVFDGRRAIGVVTHRGHEIEADRIVMSAGAIATPALLLRSRVDTPGVGAGLQDHPAVAITLELLGDRVDGGALAATVAVERRDHQLLALNQLPTDRGHGALFAARTTVASVGSVTLPDLDGPPRVELGQLADAHDLDGLTAAALDAFDVLAHPAFRDVVAAAHVDDHGTTARHLTGDPAAIRRWVPTRLGGYHHVAGSCRMGLVTDDRGEVLGYEGLVVCDASLFPGVPARNPYLSVVLLAERIAARW